MSLDKYSPTNLKYDDLARRLCKPLGCRVQGCLSHPGQGGCGQEINALNACISQKRKEIDEILKEGGNINTIKAIKDPAEWDQMQQK